MLRRLDLAPGVGRLLAVGSLGRLPAAMLPLAVLVLVAGESSTTAAGVAAGAVSLGLGTVGMATGRLLDRGRVRPVLLGLAAVHPLAAACLLAAAAGDRPALTALAALAAGLTVPPVGPLVRSTLASSVAEVDQRRVFALESVTVELVWIAGPVLAAALAAAAGPELAVVASVVAAVAGALGMVHEGIGATGTRAPAGGGGRWATPDVLRLIGSFAVVGAGFNIAMVGLAERAKDAGATNLTGLLVGVWGVGSVFGGWWVASGRPTPGIGALGLAVAAGVAVLGASSHLGALCLLLAVGGLPVAPFVSGINTLAGQVAPADARARVFATMLAANTVLSAGGTIAGAAVAEHLGPAVAFVAAGVLAGVATALAVAVERSPGAVVAAPAR